MLLSFKELLIKYKLKVSGILHIGAHYGEEIQNYVDNGVKDIVLF